ncbi:MAG TPA: RluA family pseudouridine synthase [Planctomycetes bacterium]|nr:RluA family pseudouridine synthase [Planctomycetota bacterium]
MGLFPKDRDLASAPDHVEIAVRASDFQLRAKELAIRLDVFLHHHLAWRSRTSIQRLIRDGYVSVRQVGPDGAHGEMRGETRPGRTLFDGSLVVVRIPEEHRLPPPRSDGADLQVLAEDDEVLVVNKEAGLAVHPSGRHLVDTLIQRVHARYATEAEDGKRRISLRLCHRLDRETSGVILIAKGDAVHRCIASQFEDREVEKEYLAVVHGVVAADSGVVEHPLGPARASAVRLKMRVAEDGLPSATEWTVLERHPEARPPCTLVRCRPRTGRQHQIRVHLAAIGHPIIGDKLYGEDEGLFLRAANGTLTEEDRRSLVLDRHALHAHRLTWRSPGTGAMREAVAPLPGDLQGLLGSGGG